MRRLFASFFFRIRDLMSQMDGFLACITTICCCYGLLLVATATYSFGTYKNLIVQFGGMMLGLIGIFFIMMIDVENLSSFALSLILFNLPTNLTIAFLFLLKSNIIYSPFKLDTNSAD